jgi:hypothetical protein
MTIRRPTVVLLLAFAAHGVLAAEWADPGKVLRVTFPIDVSSLDP